MPGPRERAVQQLASVISDLAGGLDGIALAKRLREIAEEAEAVSAQARQQPLPIPGAKPGPIKARADRDVAHRAAALRLFELWRKTCDHPQARPTPERLRLVIARLREGYSEETIGRAIVGCASTPFNRGERDDGPGVKHDDLTLICRNGSKVEQYAERAGEDGSTSSVPAEAQDAAVLAEIEKLEQLAWAAMEEGRTNDYNAANARLRALAAGGPAEDGVRRGASEGRRAPAGTAGSDRRH